MKQWDLRKASRASALAGLANYPGIGQIGDGKGRAELAVRCRTMKRFRPFRSLQSPAWIAVGVSLLTCAGCARGSGGKAAGSAPPAPDAERATPAATTQPTTQPAALAAPPLVFEDRDHGIRMEYPGDWRPIANTDYVLRVMPAAGEPGDTAELTLDVPDLPPHVPGMIPLALVEKGYLDDLKKGHPGLTVLERSEQAVPGARARLVRASWPTTGAAAGGKAWAENALVMVHGDHVYILRLTGPADAVEAHRPVFDEAARSIRWVK
jgi:hypothetical protein